MRFGQGYCLSCFVGVGVCFAADAKMGNWRLNEAKSKLSPSMPKNTTVVYEDAGDPRHWRSDFRQCEGHPWMALTATVSRRIRPAPGKQKRCTPRV